MSKLAKAYIKGQFPNGKETNREVIRYLSNILTGYHHELIKLAKLAAQYERLYAIERRRRKALEKRLKKTWL